MQTDPDRDARRRVLELIRFDDALLSADEQHMIRLLAGLISDNTGNGDWLCDLSTEEIARSLSWSRATVEQAILQGVISGVIAHQPFGNGFHNLAIDWGHVYDNCDWENAKLILKTTSIFSNTEART